MHRASHHGGPGHGMMHSPVHMDIHPSIMHHDPYWHEPSPMETRTFLIIVIAIAVIAVVIIVGSVIARAMSGGSSSREVTTSNYVAHLTPSQEGIIKELVMNVAPLVRGRQFTKRDIEQIIGKSRDFDQVMYFRFRQLLDDDELTVDNLTTVMAEGM